MKTLQVTHQNPGRILIDVEGGGHIVVETGEFAVSAAILDVTGKTVSHSYARYEHLDGSDPTVAEVAKMLDGWTGQDPQGLARRIVEKLR